MGEFHERITRPSQTSELKNPFLLKDLESF